MKSRYIIQRDDDGLWHGQMFGYHDIEHLKIRYQATYHHHDIHGEFKEYSLEGGLIRHQYHACGGIIHDFLENPATDEEKVLLVLKYGAPLLEKL